MRKKRRRPNELASGCKTLARLESKLLGTPPFAPWFLGVVDRESYVHSVSQCLTPNKSCDSDVGFVAANRRPLERTQQHKGANPC